MADLARKILPICKDYVRVQAFITERTNFEYGLVSHALCDALSNLLHEYLLAITQLEAQLRQGTLSLQKMYYWLLPSITTMHMADNVCAEITQRRVIGGALLNVLADKANTLGGDQSVRKMLHMLLAQAAKPYLNQVTRWIYRGAVDDPYAEFCIAKNDQTADASIDILSSYWEKMYTLRKEQLPAFLEKVSDKLFVTGKYLNVIRECGRDVACPFEAEMVWTLNEREYVHKIDRAFTYATQQLLDLLLKEKQLVKHLRSLKHFFLFDEGDFLVHFFDIADDELAKPVNEISTTKLESLLDIAVRQSSIANDPHKENISVTVLPYTLMDYLQRVHSTTMRTGTSALGGAMQSTAQGAIVGLQAIALEYDVQWPVSLIINTISLTKYQIMFRHLFYCKHVERQLCAAWQNDQSTKEYDIRRHLARMYALRQRMLQFVQNLLHYMMYEVIEPRWHVLKEHLDTATTIDEVLQHHQNFLDTMLKECMLTNEDVHKILHKVLTACVTFADYSKSLIRSLTITPGDAQEQAPGHTLTPAALKHRQEKIDTAAKHAPSAASDTAPFKMFEDAFHQSLHKLLEALVAFSQKEADGQHLTSLVQRLDFNEFYADFFSRSRSAV
eukprot:TRINITY_DN511_c0_g1_i1.p1 TRINITY_DN511_c0_g1~~TRINITY_DN511_c0_g1_i1.p1  ORF type:complete len:695 (+),score=171.59 TRINITY_DN511_c0_g1_i1:242-2086(+)